MMVRPEGLERALRDGPPILTWIHGDEPLLVIEAADRVRAAARAAGCEERVVLYVERGFSSADLAGHAGSMSLFASRRLIELRVPNSPTRELGEALAALAGSLDDSVRILATSGPLDRKTVNGAWFKALDPHMLHVAIYPIDRSRLAGWIGERLAAQGQRAGRETLELIADRVEGNLLAAHQEIRKLGLLFPEGPLAADAVRDAVLNVARYDPYALLEAALGGDVDRTRRSLDGLKAEGAAEPLVLFALADGARTLVRLFDDQRRGVAQTQSFAQARVFGTRTAAYRSAISRHDVRSARRMLQAAARADTIVKGARQGDPWQALGELALSLAGAPLLDSPCPEA
ncbi:MAG: DNA polymerase III subunit delta [Burkholderiaceae bacterium]|jgi:DNA polymerase-3 subunit delta|nr:DNA polymerase III subunit delta [Burkholderiaceae bacterium]